MVPYPNSAPAGWVTGSLRFPNKSRFIKRHSAGTKTEMQATNTGQMCVIRTLCVLLTIQVPPCNTSRMRSDLIYRHIGLLIKSRRKQLGWTQETLASRLAISRASLANIETGRQNVLVHQLYALAAALGLAASDFLPTSTDLSSKYDFETIPLPNGLSSQQKEQIARLLLSGTGDETSNLRGDDYEYKTTARPKKVGSKAS